MSNLEERKRQQAAMQSDAKSMELSYESPVEDVMMLDYDDLLHELDDLRQRYTELQELMQDADNDFDFISNSLVAAEMVLRENGLFDLYAERARKLLMEQASLENEWDKAMNIAACLAGSDITCRIDQEILEDMEKMASEDEGNSYEDIMNEIKYGPHGEEDRNEQVQKIIQLGKQIDELNATLEPRVIKIDPTHPLYESVWNVTQNKKKIRPLGE